MGVCVVENLSRVFLSKWPHIHLWVIRVYIVWVKGREVTHKNPPGRMFRDYLAGRPYLRDITCETLAKTTAWHDSSASSHVLLTWLFRDLASRKLLAKSTDSSFKLESSPT